ncbi:TadE/TadG family type IV pilus assembly protein [Psychromonas sp. MB-3u-54]|uniref:TadE/TadG family type IV pilus assembly protein n=1 Tax=Psychromonas sp. MB-3u-54 TaxID=2058319 RepID=UPI0012FF40D4|nr:Tad domain-containing protein [Psychromonas sp. MB-3u-54]
MNNVAKKYYHGQLLKKQEGNILVMFTIGLFAFIAMMALALDGGHLLLNKTRLQNFADSSALHAAVVLDLGGSHFEAREAVVEILSKNLAHADNFEIQDALNLSSLNYGAIDVNGQVRVDFSMRADPFISSTDQDAHYVKVKFLNVNLNNFFADLLSFNKQVSAVALAGPSTAIEECPTDLVPMLICSDPNYTGAEPNVFGLPIEKLYAMKSGSASASDPAIGPGNFQLLRLGTSPGGDVIKKLMAGSPFTNAENCAATLGVGDLVATEPGNKVGPASQGINTRLGDYAGTMKQDADLYPADWNTCQGEDRVAVYTKKQAKDATAASAETDTPIVYQAGDINPDTIDNAYRYNQYISDSLSCSNTVNGSSATGDVVTVSENVSTSGFERRMLKLVIGDCSGKDNGATDIPVVGLGCFFLTQTMGGGSDDFIIGEFTGDCSSVGNPSGVADDTPGPYTIVLYHVPGSKDS